MTTILIDLALDSIAGRVGVRGMVVARASRPRVEGAEVTYPHPIRTALVGGVVEAITIPASGAEWYWTLSLVVRDSLESTRTVSLPDTEVPIPWADLDDVDPSTFEPIVPTPPSAQAILTEAGEARDSARLDAESASTDAGRAETAATDAADTVSALDGIIPAFVLPAAEIAERRAAGTLLPGVLYLSKD